MIRGTVMNSYTKKAYKQNQQDKKSLIPIVLHNINVFYHDFKYTGD